MLSALEQAYLDYINQHGGSVGYGGSQAGTGTGGVSGTGPITRHADGSVSSGNGTAVLTQPDGTRVTTTVQDGLIVQTLVGTDGSTSVVTIGRNGQPIVLSGGITQLRSHNGEVVEADLKEVNETRHPNGTRTVTLLWTDGSKQIQEFRADGSRLEVTYSSDGFKHVELIAANGHSQFTTFNQNGDLYRSGTTDGTGNSRYTQHNSDGSVERVTINGATVTVNGERVDGSTWGEFRDLDVTVYVNRNASGFITESYVHSALSQTREIYHRLDSGETVTLTLSRGAPTSPLEAITEVEWERKIGRAVDGFYGSDAPPLQGARGWGSYNRKS